MAYQLLKTCVVSRAEARSHLRDRPDRVARLAIADCGLNESNYQDSLQLEIRRAHPDWNASQVIAEGTKQIQVLRAELEKDIAARLAKHAETWDPEK